MAYTLAVDIETYSSVDITKSGVYKYVESPDFTIILLAYSFNQGPVEVVDLTKDFIPTSVYSALEDPQYLKTAFNANFETTCLRTLGIEINLRQWECTMVKACMLGYPLSLDACAKAMKIVEQKDKKGTALIKYFSTPNKQGERNMPEKDLAKWQAFIEYDRQDVKVELEIRKQIEFYQVPESEKTLWRLDQAINRRGVQVDMQLVKNAIDLDATHAQKLEAEAIKMTGIDNPNSVSQLKKWLTEKTGDEVTSLTKANTSDLIKEAECNTVKRVLSIRQELAKTSIKKYQAMLSGVCKDSRVRGLLQFYGANRTGRWAGRLVQVQNLPQNKMDDLDLARELVKRRDLETLEVLFGSVPNTLSQLIRTAFTASCGKKLVVSDFSAIEARVIAWVANEKWRLDVFRDHGKIYEASASQMFKVPIEQIGKGSLLRTKGKIAELALGYQGAEGALERMGAEKMGLTLEELPGLVKAWRGANKQIVKLWYDLNEAAVEVVTERITVKVRCVTLFMQGNSLFIRLPSGRCLSYLNPRVKTNKFGLESVVYQGIDQTTRQWVTIDTYGGKLTENIVQAIARDCLADAMLRLDELGFMIVMHVHDEVVVEVPEEDDVVDLVDAIMCQEISWAPGLPLAAESFECYYYQKN